MKNYIERNFFRSFVFPLFLLFTLFLSTACQKDSGDDDAVKSFIGKWHQTSKTINGTITVKDSTRMLMQINENNICVLSDSSYKAVRASKIISRSGWSYSGGLFNLAIDIPASWIIQADATSLTLERADFNNDGTIGKTVLKFHRMSDTQSN